MSAAKEAPADTGGVARHIVATTVAGYLVQPVMFFSNLLVRRELGPFLTGVFATLTIVQTYTQLCHLGALQAAERELPVLRGAGDQARFEAIRAAAFLVALVTGLVVAVGLIGYALLERSNLEPELFRGLLAWAGLVVLQQWANAQLMALRASLQFTFLARFSVFTALLAALLNVGMVYLAGFDGLLVATLLVALSSSVAYTKVAGLPELRATLLAARARLVPHTRSLLKAGIPLLVMTSVHSLLHTIDNVMALKLLGTEWLGKYTLALSAGAVLYSFSNSVTTVLFPHMQTAYGKEGSPAAFAPFVEKPVRMLAVGLPVLIAPLFWGLPVLARGMLPKFVPGIPAFQVLVVGIVFYALAQLPHLALYAMNKIPLLVGWTVTTAAVAVACSWGFVQVNLGLTGIAAAISLAYLVFFAGLAAFALRQWRDGGGAVGFIARNVATVAVAAALFAAVERVPLPAPGSFGSDVAFGCARITLFLVLYFPVIALSDRETGLLRGHLYPAVRRMRARFSATSSG